MPPHVTIISDMSEADPGKYRLLIIVSPFIRHTPTGMLQLHFVPMVGTIGFGLSHKRGTGYPRYQDTEIPEILYKKIRATLAGSSNRL